MKRFLRTNELCVQVATFWRKKSMKSNMDMPPRWNCSMPPVPQTYHLSPKTISTGGEAYAQNLEKVSVSLQALDMQIFTATETTLCTVPWLLPRFWFTQPVVGHTIWNYPSATLTQAQATVNQCTWNIVTMNSTQHMLLIMTAHQYEEGTIDITNATNVQGTQILH